MTGLKGQALQPIEVEQYRNNKADYLHSETSKDILDLKSVMPETFLKSRLTVTRLGSLHHHKRNQKKLTCIFYTCCTYIVCPEVCPKSNVSDFIVKPIDSLTLLFGQTMYIYSRLLNYSDTVVVIFIFLLWVNTEKSIKSQNN